MSGMYEGEIYSKRPLINMDTPLKEIPKDWLDHVEHRVMRGGFLPCWQDKYAVGANGYPQIKDPNTGIVTTVQRFVASIFWDFSPHLRVRMMCRNRSCVYPHHMYICEAGRDVPFLPTTPL